MQQLCENPDGLPMRKPSQRSGRLAIIVLVAILIGLAVIYVVMKSAPRGGGMSTTHPWVGQPLPEATLQPMVNAEESIDTAEFADQVTMINFWGPWCPPCVLEFPELLKIRKKFKDQPDFQLVSIAADGQWVPSKTGMFHENVEFLKPETQLLLAQYNSDLPIYLDDSGQLRHQLNAISRYSGYPTTILVGRSGKIEAVWIGFGGDMSDASEMISKLIIEN